MNNKIKKLKEGTYKHFKGGLYEVVGTGLDSETKKELVIYSSLDPSGDYEEGAIWIRPMDMFLEEVEVDGKKQKRFELIEDN
jgi:cyclomaltodextrinase / maltogenic alpha-amylase / neopullulanase